MPLLKSMNAKFNEVNSSIKSGMSGLKSRAQGGNTIIVVYPPKEEERYFKEAKQRFPEREYKFLNLAKLFVNQVDEREGIDELVQETELLEEIPKNYFCEPFAKRIRAEIIETTETGKIPILKRVGILVNLITLNRIIEDGAIMKLQKPLIVLYPGIYHEEGGELYFLDSYRQASSYRAKVI